MKDYTAEFLNLEDVIITKVENISDQLHISIKLSRRKHVCPGCGTEADRVHSYRVQVVFCNMNLHFRQVAKTCFPRATIVSDKYYVIRQVYWAMEKIRKNERSKRSTRFRKDFKKSRNLQ